MHRTCFGSGNTSVRSNRNQMLKHTHTLVSGSQSMQGKDFKHAFRHPSLQDGSMFDPHLGKNSRGKNLLADGTFCGNQSIHFLLELYMRLQDLLTLFVSPQQSFPLCIPPPAAGIFFPSAIQSSCDSTVYGCGAIVGMPDEKLRDLSSDLHSAKS